MKVSFHRSGFSLVEVALALGIASFCLIAVFGLLPVGVNTNRDTLEQANAASVAANIVVDLRNTVLTTPASNQTSPYYQVTIPASPSTTVSSTYTHTLFLRQDGTPASTTPGPFQDLAIVPNQNPRYRATIFFTAVASSKNAVAARVLISWPALADPSPTATPSSSSASLETFTTLVRN